MSDGQDSESSKHTKANGHRLSNDKQKVEFQIGFNAIFRFAQL